MLLAASLPSIANAQAEATRPSTRLFADLLNEASKPKPKSPAVDFGKAAAACASALGKGGLDVTSLAPLGWSSVAARAAPKSTWVFEHQPSPIRIFLDTVFAPQGQCVVDGYAMSKSDFGAIAKNVKTHVGTAIGKTLKSTGKSVSPNGFSRGQGFLADQFMVAISSENRTNGTSIRITLMHIDPSKTAMETANAAAMAAQYLPMMAGEPNPTPTQQSSPK